MIKRFTKFLFSFTFILPPRIRTATIHPLKPLNPQINLVSFYLFSFLFPIFLSAQTTYYTSATPGNWGNASTWALACGGAGGAGVPTSADNVIICSGTVLMNIDGACLSLTIAGGTAQWNAVRTLAVGTGGLTLQGGTIGNGTKTGILTVAGAMNATNGTTNIGRVDLTVSGTATINLGVIVNINNINGNKTFTNLVIAGTFNNSLVNAPITIGGNLQNNGTYNAGTGTVTFTGASDNTITGSQITAFNSIAINKGASNANDLDVQSQITLTAGGLSLVNGTLKLSNASNTITPFTADPNIPATAGLWCNGSTVNSGNFSWTVSGFLKVSAGTVNLGNTANNNFLANNSAQLIMDGGTLNIAGAITKQGPGDNLSFSMTNGTLTVAAVGCTTAGISPFQMEDAACSFGMSGGILIIRSAGATNLGFTATAGTSNITGGTLQVGDASTPASQTILINTIYSLANLSVNSANATAQLAANLSIVQSITINSGTINANNLNINLGNSWTNNGTWTPGTGTVSLNGTGTQTITKSGGETFYNLIINKTTGTVSLANNLQVNGTLTMTSGNIDCGSSTLTLGSGTASAGTLSYTSGTIIGNFKRWQSSVPGSLTFPIGTSSYSRLVLVTFANIVGGTLTVNFVSTNPGLSGLPYTDDDGITSIQNSYTEGYWNFTDANGLSSTNYSLECTGAGFSSYSIGSSTRLMYRANSSNPWIANGTHTAASGSTAKRAAINGFPAQIAFGKPSCSAFAASSITSLTPSPICANQTNVDYSVNASSASNTYAWTLPAGGGTIDAPASGTAITADWGATGGQYSVQVTETNNCGDANTPIDLSVAVHPIATSTISGPTSVAANENGVAYSVTNNSGYTYNWSFPTGGGTQASGTTTNAITVNWGATPGNYTLRVDVTRACGAPDFQTLAVTVRGPIQSTPAGGSWTLGGTWVGGVAPTAADYVEIVGGATVTINNSSAACYKLTINGNANWTQARTLTVGLGGVVISSTGNITGAGAGMLISSGGLTGTLNSPISSTTVNIILQTTAGQSITSDGALNLLQVDAATTNTGTLTIANGGTLSGSSTLTQAAGATLTMNGSTFTVNLNAAASGNTVAYGANSDQTVKSTTYDNLVLSGMGTKTLGGNISVTNDLTISGVSLDVSLSNYAISVSGDWLNTGTFTPRGGTVTLNGSATQTITKATGEVFNNLVFSGAGTKQLANNVTINFDFTNSSTFDAGTNDINIKGNWDNSGSYSSNNDVTFSNNTTISGPNPSTFNNVIISGTLTGHLTNFYVTGNWTNNGSYVSNSGKVTFSGTTVIGGTATSSFEDVDITGTVTAPASNMNISGNFNNSGTFNHNNGTLTFNGSSSQTIQGNNTFNNLTINNSSTGVTVSSGSQNLINTLTLTDGTFNTNNDFTLVSNASATARIAEITLGGIIGDITMQRYVPTGTASWRQLGSSVSGRTLNDWYDDFNMCGFTGTPTCGPGFVSVMTYDESASGVKDNGWVGASNITDAITVGKGYMCYSGVGSAFNTDLEGPANTGNISLPVSYNASGGASEDGWNLVANPYPSNIDWDLVHPSSTNISSTISIWNPSSQNYAQYTVGGPDPGPNGGRRYLNSTQAFWVKATGAPSLPLTESMKTASAPTFFKTAGNPDVLKLRITANNGYSDETFIQFKENGNAQHDDADGLKFFSAYDVPHMATVIQDSFKVGLNTLPPLTSGVTIPLHAGGKAMQSIGGGLYVCNRTFTLSAYELEAISSSVCIYLEDTKTGILTDLRDSTYTFTISDTSSSPATPRFVPALTQSPRFLIHIGSPINKGSKDATCYGYSDGQAIAEGKGGGPWNYLWKDESNSVVRVASVNSADTLKNINAGVYTIEITGNNGYCSSLRDTIIVQEPTATISVIKDFAGATCFGSSDGEINLFVDGNYPPFAYEWNNDSNVSRMTNLSSQLYSVTITDSTGCYVVEEIDLYQPAALAASFTGQDTVYLSEGGYASFSNTSAGHDFSVWNFGDGSQPDSSENPVHQFSTPGTYLVSLSAVSESCGDASASASITVKDMNPNVGVDEVGQDKPEIKVGLNSDGFTIVSIHSANFKGSDLNIYNTLGQTVQFSKLPGPNSTVVIDQPSGIYLIELSSDNNSFWYKIDVH